MNRSAYKDADSDESEDILYQRSKDIQQIYGPVGISYHKIGDKNILILADMHSKLLNRISSGDDKSIYYDEFIVDIIQKCAQSDKCVDFYIEQAINEKQSSLFIGGTDYSSTIMNITPDNSYFYSTLDTITYIKDIIFSSCNLDYRNSEVKDCHLTAFKPHSRHMQDTGIKLNNLRLHCSDIRQSKNHMYKDVMYIIKNSFTKNNVLITWKLHCELTKYILSIDSPMTNSELNIFLQGEKTYDYANTRIRYDIDNIEMCLNILDRCKVLINKEFSKYEDKDEAKRIIESLYRYKTDKINNPFGYNAGMIMATLGVIMDAYLLLRMFKNFDVSTETKRNRGPLLCRHKAYQKYIIVYAGDGHTKAYNSILEDLYGPPKYITPVGREKILKFQPNREFSNFNDIMTDFCT